LRDDGRRGRRRREARIVGGEKLEVDAAARVARREADMPAVRCRFVRGGGAVGGGDGGERGGLRCELWRELNVHHGIRRLGKAPHADAAAAGAVQVDHDALLRRARWGAGRGGPPPAGRAVAGGSRVPGGRRIGVARREGDLRRCVDGVFDAGQEVEAVFETAGAGMYAGLPVRDIRGARGR
jgi:hypothetical protein